jgi:iron complex outermembrane recepter protein
LAERRFPDCAEFEVNALPVRGLLLDVGLGYLHFHTVDLGLAAAAPAEFAPTLSTVPPYVPKVKVNVGARYSVALRSRWVLTPRFDWSYQTQVYNDVANSPATRQPAYGLLNARITLEPPGGKWLMAIEGRNLTDKVYYVNMANFLPSYGTLDAQPGPPRTLLATVKRTF